MAWMDFEKFQTRSGNEPRAAALERKIANEWMGAGYTPSVIPHWQRGFTTEHSGVSPGGGNARTYEMPGKFGYSVVPEPGRKIPSFQDLMKMWQGEEEENLAGGGIASLENRPGYAWAGEVKGSDWQPSRSGDTDWRYEGRDPEGNIQATWRTNRSGPEGTGGISWDEFYRDKKFGSDYWDKHGHLTGSPRQRTEFKTGPMSSDFFNEMYPTYDDQIMRGQRGRDYQNKLGTAWPENPYSGWKSKLPVPYGQGGTDYGDEEGEFYQGGGAVGLEPGIGSLMGYAKGGMVTRVKVPKGQSKWMKKFMNSMRDS